MGLFFFMNLIFDLVPMPCPRPRIVVRGKFAHAYYPAAYKAWKEAAANAIREALPPSHVPYDTAVVVSAVFNVLRPKSTKLEAPKPDIDNYLKSLLDAMTTAEVWTDDKHVVKATALKRWADEDTIVVNIALEYIR